MRAGAAALAHDGWRDAFLKQEGYRVLRVSNSDVMANIAGVITVVLGLLEEPPPSIPPHKGEGSLAGGGGGVAG
ncbi:DUF559 domain-containing protein [Devosia limi]|uniref:DUF559 domain-containing protein n=1 Tax=Devosia limi TaxID=288995 RepID=UPI001364CE81